MELGVEGEELSAELMEAATKLKVLVLGDSGVGKSHLLACLKNSDFATEDLSTITPTVTHSWSPCALVSGAIETTRQRREGVRCEWHYRPCAYLGRRGGGSCRSLASDAWSDGCVGGGGELQQPSNRLLGGDPRSMHRV